jgi:hypothetical protein
VILWNNKPGAVNAYNLVMGIIGVKNAGKGLINFAKNLPENTKNLLQQNKGLRNLLIESYFSFKSNFSRSKAFGEYDDLDNITKENLNKQEHILDDLVNEANAISAHFTQRQIDDYVLKSTKNSDKGKVLLGKFEGETNPSSYNKRAENEGYIYFQLDDWEEAYKIVVSDDEMWRINKEFILKLKSKSIPFYFSHNPLDPKYVKGYYKREIDLLTLPVAQGGLGGKIETITEGKLWKVNF